jgi:hypothetical protein
MAPDDLPLVDQQDPSPTITTMPQLTSGFFEQLASGSFKNDGTIDPIVCVLSCEVKFESSGYSKSHQKLRRARLTLYDGIDKVILGIAVSNLLSSVKSQLSTGQPIIQLKVFTETLYKNSSEEKCWRPGIVIVQYQFLCRPAIDLDPSKYSALFRTEQSDVPQPDLSTEGIRALSQPTTDFHRRIVEFQQRADVRRLPDDPIKVCKRGDRLCSKHSQIFHYCIAEQYEARVSSIQFLEAVSEHCYFVDQEVAEMKATHKRNLLYWWFATNIYFITGAGNRKELPECLVCLVRMSYPNDPDTPYTKFKYK